MKLLFWCKYRSEFLISFPRFSFPMHQMRWHCIHSAHLARQEFFELQVVYSEDQLWGRISRKGSVCSSFSCWCLTPVRTMLVSSLGNRISTKTRQEPQPVNSQKNRKHVKLNMIEPCNCWDCTNAFSRVMFGNVPHRSAKPFHKATYTVWCINPWASGMADVCVHRRNFLRCAKLRTAQLLRCFSADFILEELGSCPTDRSFWSNSLQCVWDTCLFFATNVEWVQYEYMGTS